MDETRGMTIKGLLIRLVLIAIFIFLLIWLFPMPDLKPLNNQIFADNIDRMKDAAKSYYTLERLPKDINSSKRMTLKEMIEKHLILPLMDSNGNYCSEEDSYVQITKLENEYVIKVQLSCTDKKDYINEHYGCYDICTKQCQMLENASETTTQKITTPKVTTNRNNGKIYEYEFSRNECSNKFEKYVCPAGYYLVGNSCIKNGSEVVSVPAKKTVTPTSSVDTKNAKKVETKDETKVSAICVNGVEESTIAATPANKVIDQVVVGTQKVTADAKNTYDVKGAVATTKTYTSDYKVTKTYDVITANKIIKWAYVSTITSEKSNLEYTGENEKIVFVESYLDTTCATCFTPIRIYKYYKYKKQTEYSCTGFDGYSLYDTNKCRKLVNEKKECPDNSYTNTGTNCVKKETTYSCSKYGTDYKLDETNKTCKKLVSTSYSCPSGTTKTSDPKYCTKNIYGCPSGTTITNGKCSYVAYTCPTNTSTKTYTLNGNKCDVKTKVEKCDCPVNSTPTSDKKVCIKTTTNTRYSCDDYSDYVLNGTKCTKLIITDKTSYSCDSGYILNGTNCVKTVNTSSTKNAEATYKNVCEQKYKWSTSTSINGWTYTGNKREVK